MLEYANLNNLCAVLHYLVKWGNTKIIFSLKCCISQERCSSWTVLYAQCASALSSWKKNYHLWCVW